MAALTSVRFISYFLMIRSAFFDSFLTVSRNGRVFFSQTGSGCSRKSVFRIYHRDDQLQPFAIQSVYKPQYFLVYRNGGLALKKANHNEIARLPTKSVNSTLDTLCSGWVQLRHSPEPFRFEMCILPSRKFTLRANGHPLAVKMNGEIYRTKVKPANTRLGQFIYFSETKWRSFRRRNCWSSHQHDRSSSSSRYEEFARTAPPHFVKGRTRTMTLRPATIVTGHPDISPNHFVEAETGAELKWTEAKQKALRAANRTTKKRQRTNANKKISRNRTRRGGHRR